MRYSVGSQKFYNDDTSARAIVAPTISSNVSCLPGYVASSFSSLRSLCLISGESSAAAGGAALLSLPASGFEGGAFWRSPPSVFFAVSSSAATVFSVLAVCVLSAVEDSFSSLCAGSVVPFSGGAGAGVVARLGSSLSPMTKASSKTAGSGLIGASVSFVSPFPDLDFVRLMLPSA